MAKPRNIGAPSNATDKWVAYYVRNIILLVVGGAAAWVIVRIVIAFFPGCREPRRAVKSNGAIRS
jgi:hypothetical protein